MWLFKYLILTYLQLYLLILQLANLPKSYVLNHVDAVDAYRDSIPYCKGIKNEYFRSLSWKSHHTDII